MRHRYCRTGAGQGVYGVRMPATRGRRCEQAPGGTPVNKEHTHAPSGLLRRFTLAELLILALLASLGIAAKPLIVPAARLLARTLLLPTGALAGGFYMLWLVLGAALVRKTGSATLVALVQALIVAITGMPGSHGPLSLLTYVLPGVAADLAIAVTPAAHTWLWRCLAGGAAANLCGMILANLIFYRLGPIPLAIASVGATLSGAVGGFVAWTVARRIPSMTARARSPIRQAGSDGLSAGD
ncbi:MAG: hypothetical protein GF331_21200 [Chitinivibrionales bacterium]|nr:hypothetical protein [Chitinivibrionales bacterium]